MPFSAIFAMSSFLATLVIPSYPLSGVHDSKGCEWGCCDGICLLRYKKTFFPISSLAEGR